MFEWLKRKSHDLSARNIAKCIEEIKAASVRFDANLRMYGTPDQSDIKKMNKLRDKLIIELCGPIPLDEVKDYIIGPAVSSPHVPQAARHFIMNAYDYASSSTRRQGGDDQTSHHDINEWTRLTEEFEEQFQLYNYETALYVAQRACDLAHGIANPPRGYESISISSHKQNQLRLSTSLFHMGIAYEALRKHALAVSCLKRALEPADRIFRNEPNNMEMRLTRNALDALYKTHGLTPENDWDHEIVVPLQEEKYPKKVKDLCQEAHLCCENQRYGPALFIHEQALKLLEELWGSSHPDLADACIELGEYFRAQFQCTYGMSLFNRAITIRERSLGPDNPNLAKILEHTARLYRVMKMDSMAIPLEKRAALIRAKAR